MGFSVSGVGCRSQACKESEMIEPPFGNTGRETAGSRPPGDSDGTKSRPGPSTYFMRWLLPRRPIAPEDRWPPGS